MLRLAPILALVVLTGPILCGLLATIFPAFGFFPALGGDSFSLKPFADLFAMPGIWRSVFLSLWVGVTTTVVSVVIVMMFVAGWSNTIWFRRMQQLISPLLSVPHAAAAFGLAFMIAPSGWLLRLTSPELTGFTRPPDLLIINDPLGFAMMAGLIAKEIPFIFLVTLSALPQVQPARNLRAARNLGYGRMAAFLFAVWPRVYPQIRLAVFAVIAYASSVVDVALILGPTNPAPLPVRLITWMGDPDLGMRFMASAGAVLQLGVTIAALLVWLAIERVGRSLLRVMTTGGARFQGDGILRSASALLVVLPMMVIFGGLGLLAVWSVSGFWPFPDALPRDWTLRHWQRQLNGGLASPFYTTLAVGLISVVVALAIALSCLERETRTGRTGGNRALAFIYLPLLVPQASFVFGLQLFFLIIGLDTSLSGLIFVHIVFVLPYLFLSLSDPWRAFDVRYAHAARSMGASPNRIFWRIRAPMLLRSILIASAVGFAVSIGQYLPTVLIGSGRWPTITTEAVALASGGDRRVIGVFAFVQLLLPFVGFLIAAAIPALVYRNRRDMRVSD